MSLVSHKATVKDIEDKTADGYASMLFLRLCDLL
jgi:hypothetical protein